MSESADNQLPRVLISAEELDLRISQLATEIERDYQDTTNLLCIGILKGSVFFLAQLLKQVANPLSIGFLKHRATREQLQVRCE